MPSLGRFRVNYLTQRGSHLASIQRIPFDIPTLQELLADPSQMTLVEAMLNYNSGGIVYVTGSSPASIARFVYGVLSHINNTRNTVICIYEQILSYLLRHKNSVVIQVEAGTDAPTLEQGIRSGLFLCPDTLYARDCRSPSELSSLICAAETGTLVLTSAVSFTDNHLLENLRGYMQEDYETLHRHIRQIVRVSANHAGKITLSSTALQEQDHHKN
jgi:Tfp pilus assembly pilus retraction ATPase PilT